VAPAELIGAKRLFLGLIVTALLAATSGCGSETDCDASSCSPAVERAVEKQQNDVAALCETDPGQLTSYQRKLCP
jgi:hypothetical protein